MYFSSNYVIINYFVVRFLKEKFFYVKWQIKEIFKTF